MCNGTVLTRLFGPVVLVRRRVAVRPCCVMWQSIGESLWRSSDRKPPKILSRRIQKQMRMTSGWTSIITFTSMAPTTYSGKRGAFFTSAPSCTSAFACAMLVRTKLIVDSLDDAEIPERASIQASIAPTSLGNDRHGASAITAWR